MTTKPPGSESTLDTLWMLDQDADGPAPTPAQSIRYQGRAFSSTALESMAQKLPRLVLLEGNEAEPSGDLILGPLLGEGSMGQVYQANQVSLRRQVAVKTISPDKDPRKMTEMLLRETWVTGWLEHPNIVPVHLLGTDAEGQPILVMKQIEGVLWSDLQQDDALLQDYLDEGESPLEWHIKTLLQVCRAIEFAHSRGIIHRDLKPSNVMIGAFGEVYALDWGLALQVEAIGDAHARPPLPKASETNQIAGTPSYMAPEMALGEGDKLSYGTDIYLLGALLHEIVMGTPPHSGETLKEILRHVLDAKPYAYPEEIPQELRAICLRAMDPNPAKRYPDIKAMRHALQSFLQHQESYHLGEKAKAPLERLLATSPQALQSQDLREIYDRFGRCHFGLQRALELWPDNEAAKASIQALLEWMISFEIAQQQVESAARWLAELPTPHPESAAAVESARARQADARQELRRLQQIQGEVDLSASRSFRRKSALVMAFVWFLVSVLGVTLAFTKVVIPGHGGLLACNLVFAFAVSITIFIGRDIFLNNHANRQMVLLFVLFCSVIIMARLSFMLIDVTFRKSIILEYITFINFVGMMSVLYNRRILWAACLYLLAMIGSHLSTGDSIYVIMAITHPSCLIIVSWFWTEPDYHAASPAQPPPPAMES